MYILILNIFKNKKKVKVMYLKFTKTIETLPLMLLL